MNNNIDPKKSDEIDLIQLFNYFGDKILGLISNFKKLLAFLFDKIIVVLLFIKKQAIKIAIATILGGCIGYFLQRGDSKLFSSVMIVHPNFESSRQVYTSIEYLNQLAINGSYVRLSNELQISEEEARSINSLYCKPMLEENNKIKVFDEFVASLRDTASASKVDYKDFVKNLSDYDNKYHKIVVESTNRYIYTKLQNNIIDLIERNEYFKSNVKIKAENINKSDSIYKKQLEDIDDLREVYNKVLLASSKADDSNSPRTGGNTFNFAQDDNKTNEIQLLKESRIINDKLTELNDERIRLTSIINVIADFNPIGIPVTSLARNKIVIWSIIFAILSLVVIMVNELNKFLNNYKKRY